MLIQPVSRTIKVTAMLVIVQLYFEFELSKYTWYSLLQGNSLQV